MGALQLTLGGIAVLLGVVAWGMFAATIARFVRVIRLGQPDSTRNGPFMPRMKTLIKEFAAHTRMNRKRSVGPAHWLVMWGFLLGSLAPFEAYGEGFARRGVWPLLDDSPPFQLLMELLGLGTIVGILVLMAIRQRNHPRRADRQSRFAGSNFKWAYFIEAVVLIEGIGIIGVRAAKSALNTHEGPLWASFVSNPIGQLLPASPNLVTVFAFVKLMSATVWLIVVARTMTMGIAWHRFSAFFNIYFKREADGGVALGPLQPMTSNGKPIDFEDPGEDDVFGRGKIEDFTWKGMLDFTTCTECGRCQSQCPAWNTGKPLSPKMVIMDLRDHLYAKAPYLTGAKKASDNAPDFAEYSVLEPSEEQVWTSGYARIPGTNDAQAHRPLVGTLEEGGVIDPDVLWSCTNCGACVEQCPVDIEHIDHIVDMRRYQTMIESNFPSEAGGMLKNLEKAGNPWGMPSRMRTEWTKDLGFPVKVLGEDVEDLSEVEYLFWVGCAGSLDDKAQKTTKAV